MKAITCPRCRQPIPAEDVNVAQDVAYCRRCNAAASLAEFVHDEVAEVNLQRPPAGTWHEPSADGPVFGASHRTWLGALGALGICLFWNGIVSVFVAVALSGTLHNLGITPPAWFPAPVMNKQEMGPGMVTFLWLFLTPFIVIGTGMFIFFISSLVGRTEVRVGRDKCAVFVGAGPLGWTRRFDPREVARVAVGERVWNQKNQAAKPEIHIVLRSGKIIKFGSSLSEERFQFLLAATRQALRPG